ncbi:hypothetical protein AB0870_12045 [Microbacterium proteolyticum]|uniref:hypothetical protein n=1 Tax=Microbacterium proteolyticum TaxID=1572644 RepID=UPI0030FB6E74
MDLDHNGAAAILARFRSFGVSVATLSDVRRFRLVDDAEDADTIRAVVADCVAWTPTLAVIDPQGELLPLSARPATRPTTTLASTAR